MKHRLATLFVFTYLFAGCASTQAIRPAEISVDELLVVMDLENQMAKGAELGAMMGGGNEMMANALKEFMGKYFKWDEMKPQFAKIYTDAFTPEEIEQLIVFYRSDLGKSVLAAQPTIAMESVKISQAIMVKHQAEFMKMIQNAASGSSPQN